MKIIFSPSKEMNKKMNFEKECLSKLNTDASYKTEATYLNSQISQLSASELQQKFKIKDLVLDNFLLNIKEFGLGKCKPAIEAYSGLSFRQLELNNYNFENWEYIKNNVMILSALYGVNRGTDLIEKHRLDFTIKLLENTTLYSYWSDKINTEFEEVDFILNLASEEYSKMINRKIFNVIDVFFYENLDFKIISANAKKSRGQMLNFMIKNEVKDIGSIKTIKEFPYEFNEELSTETKLIFIKK